MKNKRRFTEHFKTGKPLTLKDDSPAVIEGRTMFPSRVTSDYSRVLKKGEHQRKIGSHVVKGRWAGFPIFTLTLEERATCPRSCHHWNDCYGNKMHFPKRHRPGLMLETALFFELENLNKTFPQGFVVRLHILGDFYSVDYVDAWDRWMSMFPALHVFGYTARWVDEDIGRALMMLRVDFPERWWVRFSHRDQEAWLSTGESGIICPVQTGKSNSCGDCGLCWTAKKPIRFLLH